jgi:hypothetical protein
MDTYILIFSFVLLGFLTYIQDIFSISLIDSKPNLDSWTKNWCDLLASENISTYYVWIYLHVEVMEKKLKRFAPTQYI